MWNGICIKMKKILKHFTFIILWLTSFATFKYASAVSLLPIGEDPATWRLNPADPSTDIVSRVMGNAVNLLFGLAGGVAAFMLVYSGFMYITAYGNETRATQAKTTMLYSIVGVIIVMASFMLYEEIVRTLR